MKKLLGLLGCLLISLSVLAGCGEEETGIKIGILQGIEHEALNQARQGFIDAVNESGLEVEFDYKNALDNDADLKTFASSLVRNSDLVLGIGTGSAQTLQAASSSVNSTKPIMFTAVSDPVGANLVDSLEKPGANITGTHDMNPVNEQIALIEEILGTKPEKVGILYRASEQNSETQAKMASEALKAKGIEPVVMTVMNASDIQMTIRSMAKDIDALYIPTDNLLAANMSLVNQVAVEEKLLVCVGCKEMVDDGGSCTLGIDYYELGRLTGEMAVEILNGADVSTMPVQSLSLDDCELQINEANLAQIGITYNK